MTKKRDRTTLDALIKHLADEFEVLSVAKLYGLSGLEEDALAQVRAVWPTLPDERRRAVVRHLADIAENNFEVDFGSLFRLSLQDADAAVRETAIDGLWEDQAPELIPLFVQLAQHDPAESVRAAATGALGRYVYLSEIEEIPASQVQPALRLLRAIIAAPAEPLEVRRRAVEAISFCGDDDVPGLIRAAYASPDEPMRISAVFAMGSSADDQWIDTVVAELEAQAPAMRYETARAAGELEARAAVPALGRLLDDPDREVQEMAVWALGQIGGDHARKLLAKTAKSNDEGLAEAALEAIEELDWMHGGDRDMPLFMFDPHADEADDEADE